MEHLKEKGIKIEPADAGSVKLGWDMAFAGAVVPAALEEIFYDQFRWHLFSYEKLSAKTGADADKALAEKQVRCLFVFWQNSDEAYELVEAYDLNAEDVAKLGDDVYIFDADGCWTYVKTHEAFCGPYFFQW